MNNNPSWNFLSGVRKNAIALTNKRPTVMRSFVIPPFDPFHDHLTSLILKDRQVMWTVNRLNYLQDWDKLEMSIKQQHPTYPQPRHVHIRDYLLHKVDMTEVEAIGLGRGLNQIDVMYFPPAGIGYKE